MSETNTKPAASELYFLVIVPDDGKPEILSMTDIEEVKKAISAHVLEATEQLYAYLFKGQRIMLESPRAMTAIKLDGSDNSLGITAPGGGIEASGRIYPLRAIKGESRREE